MTRTDIGTVYSNFDHTFDESVVRALQEDSDASLMGGHTAWNYFGHVWCSDGVWHEDVWIYGVSVAILTAPTLSELIAGVLLRYGRE